MLQSKAPDLPRSGGRIPETGGWLLEKIVFTAHSLQRMKERGTNEQDIREAIRIGRKEPAKGKRSVYRLNLEFKRTWDGRYYGIQQVAPVVIEEGDEIVVITVYTFYFQEGGKP